MAASEVGVGTWAREWYSTLNSNVTWSQFNNLPNAFFRLLETWCCGVKWEIRVLWTQWWFVNMSVENIHKRSQNLQCCLMISKDTCMLYFILKAPVNRKQSMINAHFLLASEAHASQWLMNKWSEGKQGGWVAMSQQVWNNNQGGANRPKMVTHTQPYHFWQNILFSSKMT